MRTTDTFWATFLAVAAALALALMLAVSADAATRTWTNADAGDSNWSTAGNWAEGAAAVSLDTIDRTTLVDPTIDVNQTGWTLDFDLTAVGGSLSDFIGGTGIAGTVQNVASAITVLLDKDVTGTLSASGGTTQTGAATVAVTGAVTVARGATLIVSNGHTLTCPTVSLAGVLWSSGGTFDVDGLVTCTAETAEVAFCENDGEIQGGFDAAGYAVACYVTGDTATLTLDAGGGVELDLGTEVASWADVQVNVVAGCDQVLQRDANVKGISLTGGAFDFGDAGRTITVHSGGFYHDNSAAIGTAGCITVASGATATAGSWHDASEPLALLTVNGDLTFNAPLRVEVQAFAGSGSVDVSSKRLRCIYPAANFWTFSGSLTDGGANGLVELYLNASRSNAASIEAGSVPVLLSGTASYTLTAAGGMTCADLVISSPANQYTKLDVTGGNLAATGDVLFGLAAAEVRSGKLALSAGGDHAIGGDLKEQAACTGDVHEVDLGGTVRFAGDMTLNDIDVDLNSAVLIATGTGKTLDGAGATAAAATAAVVIDDGNATPLTVANLDTADQVITVNCTDGGGNGAGVQFRRTGFGGFGF